MPLTLYSTGTISVANGSANVTGAGAGWLLAGVTGGFLVSPLGEVGIVQAVVSDTELTLKRPWGGATLVASPYDIELRSAEIASSIWSNQILAEIVARVNAGSFLDFDATGTLAERAAYDASAKGFIYAQTDVTPFLITIKKSATSGDWSSPVSLQGPAGDPASSIPTGEIWSFDSGVNDSDPGVGKFRFNNTTPSIATTLFIDNNTIEGASATPWLDSIDDSTNTAHRGYIALRGLTHPEHFIIFSVTGSIVDGTGYRKVTVAHLSSNLTGLALGDRFAFAFHRTGNLGATGATGPAIGVYFNYSTTTADADPGAGAFRFNNATIASATAAYIDNTDAFSNAVTAWLDTFDDSTNPVRGTLTIRGVSVQTAYAVFDITGSVVDGTGYRKLTLVHKASGGVWTNGNTFSMDFSRAGDAGAGSVNSVNGQAGVVVLTTKDVEPGTVQTIASAATTNLSASPAFRYLITGTTTITAITLGANKSAVLRFGGALTLTHNATSLILPTGANIVTAAGDIAEIETDGADNVRVFDYQRANGQPLALPAAAPAREFLTAARTYYVSTTGNNSNNGLSIGAPFLTIQKALDIVFGTLDLGGQTVTIQLADGTYTSGAIQGSPQTGSGDVIINGNAATPANVIINATSSICLGVDNGAKLRGQNFEVRTTTAGRCISAVGFGSEFIIGVGIRFGASAEQHLLADYGGLITFASNYSIVGGAVSAHIFAANGGQISCAGKTVTLTGTPAFGYFIISEGLSNCQIFSNTYSGGATGIRYLVSYNGYIHTNGAGANYFPGSVAGSANTGGLYR